MPPLSELPGDVPRDRFLRALRRVGFTIDVSGGNGDHVMATWPTTNKSLAVPHRMIPKQVLKYLLKEIEAVTLSRVSWEVIRKEL